MLHTLLCDGDDNNNNNVPQIVHVLTHACNVCKRTFVSCTRFMQGVESVRRAKVWAFMMVEVAYERVRMFNI